MAYISIYYLKTETQTQTCTYMHTHACYQTHTYIHTRMHIRTRCLRTRTQPHQLKHRSLCNFLLFSVLQIYNHMHSRDRFTYTYQRHNEYAYFIQMDFKVDPLETNILRSFVQLPSKYY